MIPESKRSLVEDMFRFGEELTLNEILDELKLLGLTHGDLDSEGRVLVEVTIAWKIRRVCSAFDIPITPHQSLTLAKHLQVGEKFYRNGVPLSDQERAIAVQIRKLHFEAECQKRGVPFTEEIEKDAERWVKFGEHGLTVGHKIGEATGCFQALLLVALSTVSCDRAYLRRVRDVVSGLDQGILGRTICFEKAGFVYATPRFEHWQGTIPPRI